MIEDDDDDDDDLPSPFPLSSNSKDTDPSPPRAFTRILSDPVDHLMGSLFCRRSGLFPAQPSRCTRGERRISPLGTNRVVSRSILDRRKRLPQSQDSIEALPPGGR